VELRFVPMRVRQLEDPSVRIMIRCIGSINGKPIFEYSR
jgi:hypothetical protein